MTRLVVVLVAVACVVMAYRLVVLSEPANWLRAKTRAVTGRRSRIPRWKRRLVWWLALGRCRDCRTVVTFTWRADDRSMETDHRHPWSAGGSDSIFNLACRCRPCNADKGARVPR